MYVYRNTMYYCKLNKNYAFEGSKKLITVRGELI